VGERSKPSDSENSKSRVRYVVENQQNVLITRRTATVSIVCGLLDFRWFSDGFSYTSCTTMQQSESPL
jgi:hypothetical protein